MRLDEFERKAVGDLLRLTAPLTDENGEQAYQLLVQGPEEQVMEAFRESDFKATIRPGGTEEEWQKETRRVLPLGDEVVAPEAFDDVHSLFKRTAPSPSAEDSLLVALRREKPGGTAFILSLPLFVPFRFNVFFFFPLAFTCSAFVSPFSGDPDLFLSLNSPGAPAVAASARAGLSWDSVGFSRPPWFPFFPFFRVFGFAPSFTQFTGTSFGIP